MATKQQPTEVMTALGGIHDRVSALAAALKELVIAECLTTVTLAIGPAGYAEFDYPVPFASVAITNAGTTTMTAVGATVTDTAPTVGTGVALVAAGKGAVHNISSRVLTIYGTAGDHLTLSVFARPQPPAWG